MQLVLDIGNTRRKAELFRENELLETQIVDEWSIEDLVE